VKQKCLPFSKTFAGNLLFLSFVLKCVPNLQLRWFRKEVYPVYVHPPRNPADLAKAMGPYCALGLNGAFESTDAVHVHWGELFT